MKWYKINEKLPPNAKMVLCFSRKWTDPLTCYQCGGKFYHMNTDNLGSQPEIWGFIPSTPLSYNSGYMVRLAKAILSQIAKATSYIRKRCVKPKDSK